MTITVGPLSPGTMDQQDFLGSSTAWTNIDNAKVSDNSYASYTYTFLRSYYLIAKNFGFSIPDTATITGVQIEFEGTSDVNSGGCNAVSGIIKNGATEGTFQTNTWTSGEKYYSKGGTSNLLGASLSYSDVNSSNFGMYVFQNSGWPNSTQIDHMRMSVSYTDYGHTSVSVDYGSWKRLGSSNTPITLTFTAGSEATNWDLRTAAGGGGSLIASGTCTSGVNNKSLNNSSFSSNGDINYYLRTGNGTSYADASTVMIKRTDANVSLSGVPYQPYTTPTTVPTPMVYTLSFREIESYSPDTDDIQYEIRTGANRTGTLLASGNCTHNVTETTTTINDSGLVTGNNTRYIYAWSSSGKTVSQPVTISANILTVANAGSISPAAELSRKTYIPQAGSISPTGMVNFGYFKTLAGSISSISATLGALRTFPVSISGTLSNLSGSIIRRTNKSLDGNLFPSGYFTIQNRILRLAGAITPSGSLNISFVFLKSISGSLSNMTGGVTTSFNKYRFAIMRAGKIISHKLSGGNG